MRREFLQLADTCNPAKHKIAGWYISEKLDGTRCLWDGGASRGFPTDQVPWASVTDPKTGGLKAKIKPLATGLWSRYGNPIMAPDWFLDQLPACPLDGELWAGRGKFQLCRSICAGDNPDPRFDQIQYRVYSAPGHSRLFADGLIKNANMVRQIDLAECLRFTKQQCLVDRRDTFEWELSFLGELKGAPLYSDGQWIVHEQVRLSGFEFEAWQEANAFMDEVLSKGGEGCVIRDPAAAWTPKRHKGLLKYKPFQDAEAVITGFTSGRKTDKGSKLLGKIGALVCDFKGKRLELAGLTDEEREFATPEAQVFATGHPGQEMPACFQGKHFVTGQTVTFKYRELSDDGIPKEGRYWRKRDVE